jgi:acyl carrier protein phosphodiesterase
LHREIDSYTDLHPATREAKEFFRPAYRLYSGAIVDVIYDHFLAADENEFTESSLLAFSRYVYEMLEDYRPWLPENFSRMFIYMKEQNWLYHYRELPGAEKAIGAVVGRARYIDDPRPAFKLLMEHYQLLGILYRQFWTDLKTYARQQFQVLTGQDPK